MDELLIDQEQVDRISANIATAIRSQLYDRLASTTEEIELLFLFRRLDAAGRAKTLSQMSKDAGKQKIWIVK